MWKKINNWTLPFLVFGVSVLSIALIYQVVWAQFVPPDSQPGDTITVGLTMNPMVADLDLNNKNLIDGTFSNVSTKKGLVAASTAVVGKAAVYGESVNAAGYAIHGVNTTDNIAGYFEGLLCLNGTDAAHCINAWPSSTGGGGGGDWWQHTDGAAGKIIYSTSTNGNPDANAELDIQSGALSYWALYHSKLDSSGDLRFWNNGVPGDKNALTMETSGEVGIGTVDPAARLEVRSSGSGDILNLYDGAAKVFSVADGGATTLSSGDLSVTSGNVLLTNGALGISTTPGAGIKLDVLNNTGFGINTGGIIGIVASGSSQAGIFSGSMLFQDNGGVPSTINYNNNTITYTSFNVNYNTNGVNYSGNVTQSGGYYSMRKSSIAPTATDCDTTAERGRVYLDYQNDRLYVCSGAAPAWKYSLLTP